MTITRITSFLSFSDRINRENINEQALKIYDFVKKIPFIALGVAFLSINSGFFFIGLVIGWVWKDECDNEMKKVGALWKKYVVDEENKFKKAAIYTGISVGSLLTLQYIVPFGAFLYAAKVGAMASNEAEKI